METLIPFIRFAIILVTAPLLSGIINRVKANFAGRQGKPVLQLYYDIFKLLHKKPMYSHTTSVFFKANPLINLCVCLTVLMLTPFAGTEMFFSFDGDLVFIIYLLGLARFFMVLAALDTGSSFEGMGASREMQFAAFAEPALFLALGAIAKVTNTTSLAGMFEHLITVYWQAATPVLLLSVVSIFIILLAENCRIPADDPNTHLELTMIHEAMILDYSGANLACLLYASSLKLWIFSSLCACAILPSDSTLILGSLYFVTTILVIAVIVGITESVMARLRMLKVPYMLMMGLTLSVLALLFQTGK